MAWTSELWFVQYIIAWSSLCSLLAHLAWIQQTAFVSEPKSGGKFSIAWENGKIGALKESGFVEKYLSFSGNYQGLIK
jgi:hypothetical protein